MMAHILHLAGDWIDFFHETYFVSTVLNVLTLNQSHSGGEESDYTPV